MFKLSSAFEEVPLSCGAASSRWAVTHCLPVAVVFEVQEAKIQDEEGRGKLWFGATGDPGSQPAPNAAHVYIYVYIHMYQRKDSLHKLHEGPWNECSAGCSWILSFYSFILSVIMHGTKC